MEMETGVIKQKKIPLLDLGLIMMKK